MRTLKQFCISIDVVKGVVDDLVESYNDLGKVQTADYRENHIRGHILKHLLGLYHSCVLHGQLNGDKALQHYVKRKIKELSPAYYKEHLSHETAARLIPEPDAA